MKIYKISTVILGMLLITTITYFLTKNKGNSTQTFIDENGKEWIITKEFLEELFSFNDVLTIDKLTL